MDLSIEEEESTYQS